MPGNEPTSERNLDGYGAPQIEWARVREVLDLEITQAPDTGGPGRHISWLTTINPDGSPHVMPLRVISIDGSWYFTSKPGTRKSRNLARDPRCVISIATHPFDLVVEGKAERVVGAGELQRVAETYAAQGWPARVEGGHVGEYKHTPFIAGIAWTGNTSAPGVIHVSVFLFNPDAERHFFVFLYAFVGPAHLTAEIGQALAQVDERFPRITTPAFFGHILEPSQDVDFSFDIDVRAGVTPSNYIGNAFVFKADFFDDNVGDVLDRGVFIFGVTGT